MVNMSKKGSELSELISAWSWAVGSFKSSNSNLNRINLDYQSTARAAQRLRAMRSDLMLLLNNIPEDQIKPKEQNDSESQLFDKNTNEMIITAQFDEYEGSTSGDWDVDVAQLMDDNKNNRDLAIMVRHGLLDDMIDNVKTDMNPLTSADSQLNAKILEPATDKIAESQYTDYENEDNVPVASLDDMPTFDKVIYSHRNGGRPKLVTGENNASNSGKSQWLTLSVVGSLAAIVLTVTLTVFARRIKSTKQQDSGTPIQKLRRFNPNLKSGPVHGNGQMIRTQSNHFGGYNAAYKPQSMDSGVGQEYSTNYSTNSSQISSSSGSFVPQRQYRQPGAFNGTGGTTNHVNFASHQPRRQPSNPPSYPNRNRALPPPPYSRIEY